MKRDAEISWERSKWKTTWKQRSGGKKSDRFIVFRLVFLLVIIWPVWRSVFISANLLSVSHPALCTQEKCPRGTPQLFHIFPPNSAAFIKHWTHDAAHYPTLLACWKPSLTFLHYKHQPGTFKPASDTLLIFGRLLVTPKSWAFHFLKSRL